MNYKAARSFIKHKTATNIRLLSICFLLLLPFPEYGQNIFPVATANDFVLLNSDSLKTKRIIGLGEENHRVETYSRYKSDLVQLLHEKYNFDVIVFESSFSACAEAFSTQTNDTTFMKEALYSVWQSQSVLGLFDYIEQTKKTNDPLILLGFDFKGGGDSSYRQSKWMEDFYSRSNPVYGKTLYSIDTTLLHTLNDWETSQGKKIISKEEQERFEKFYRGALEDLQKNKKVFISENQLSDNQFKIFERSLENRIYLSTFISLKDLKDCLRYRDKAMSENMKWIAEVLYPDKKIIFWGADLHLRKTYDGAPKSEYQPSGTLLPQTLKEQFFVVSLCKMSLAEKANKKLIKAIDSNAVFFRPAKQSALSQAFDGIIYFKETESTKDFQLR